MHLFSAGALPRTPFGNSGVARGWTTLGAIRRGGKNGVITAKNPFDNAKNGVLRGISHLTTFGSGAVRPGSR